MKRFILLLVLTGGLMGILPGENLNLAKVGEWGSGEYNDVFVAGNYAYCAASGSGLDIIDIGNPSAPKPVGKFDTPGGALGIYARNNYAYMVNGEGGFEVIDITNPSYPIRVGTSDIKAVYPRSMVASGKIHSSGKVKVKGNYAYVCGENDVKVIDVSTPSSPTLLREVEINGVPSDISFKGNYAYVSTSVNLYTDEVPGVHVLDVSNPTTPKVVGVYNNGYTGDSFGIDIEANFAYLLDYSRLIVLDITNPSEPVKVGACECFSSVGARHDVYVKVGYAYIAAYDGGVAIVDVSDPTSPTLASSYEVPGNAYSVSLQENLLYTACGEGGLRILDVSKPGAPTLKGNYDVSGLTKGLYLKGNDVYLARERSGLEVIDVSVPSSPYSTGSSETPGAATAVVVSGRYAYVADEYEGLWIIDVSNPAVPAPVGLYNTDYGIYDVFVDGNYAYVTLIIGGLDIVDVSNPAVPVRVGTYDDTGSETGVYVRGNYAYITLFGGGLKIVDVSNPTSPTAKGTCVTPRYAYDVYVSGGNEAYVANGENGLVVIDISDSAAPTLKGTYDTGGNVYNVYTVGTYAYLADGKNGLVVLDISNPAAPLPAGHYDTPGEARDVHANGDYIYVADGNSGKLLILKVFNPAATPQISLDRTRLTFTSTLDTPGTGYSLQSILIENSGGGSLSWSTAVDRDWLSCSPLSGTDRGEISVSVDTTGLPAGTYWGNITVTDPEALNSPQQVAVIVKVYEPGQTSAPFGVFATPSEGSTVAGSIPVTGWVLDDIGVQSVQIFREQGNSLVYIDDAVFVAGARPDVAQVYPWYPMNDKAGWGYMLLTNFLPGGGNGTFKIHAIATDLEGHQVTLGVKTILGDNANAVEPFGAIDTPTQGGTASGSDFVNFGWALTPTPNTIPTDGSTIRVWVDGVSLGHPVYNRHREDIASLFPGYHNSEGAGGYFYLDTTAYENGVHTIAWSVTDDAGYTDGIGSRYFSIQNPGNREQASGNREEPPIDFSRIPADDSGPVGVIRGYRQDEEPQEIYPDEHNTMNIEIHQLERLAVYLAETTSGLAPLSWGGELPGGKWMGYQVVGKQLRPLPIGSFLDSQGGIFYWQPGTAFVGNYQLIFIDTDRYGNMIRKNVSVTISAVSTGPMRIK